jgi:hypothetical protein
MNDGVKILLDRMKTHPEEFVDETNLGATKWSGVLNYYDNVLTPEEKKAIQEGLLQLKRDAFTKQVMEILLDEVKPVEIDPNTFTFKTAGRDMWGTTTLELQEAQEQQQRTKLILEREVAKLKLGGLK